MMDTTLFLVLSPSKLLNRPSNGRSDEEVEDWSIVDAADLSLIIKAPEGCEHISAVFTVCSPFWRGEQTSTVSIFTDTDMRGVTGVQHMLYQYRFSVSQPDKDSSDADVQMQLICDAIRINRPIRYGSHYASYLTPCMSRSGRLLLNVSSTSHGWLFTSSHLTTCVRSLFVPPVFDQVDSMKDMMMVDGYGGTFYYISDDSPNVVILYFD